MRCTDSLETEITNFLTDFDIENDEHKVKLLSYKTMEISMEN